MPDSVRLVAPDQLDRNPDNPRLIFRQEDLDSLERSIADQGILVPLTVYEDGKKYRLLDGERRWRCALKLGLSRVPVIVQPKPARLQNLMMMFAIHHARTDWDPLPTALKLQDLEAEFYRVHGKSPTESELAGLASMTRGEVRRLKMLLLLPQAYREELLRELEKPRSEQKLTVDHILEISKAAALLRKRGVIPLESEDELRRALIAKVRSGVMQNTVEPRLLARLSRAVERGEVTHRTAASVVDRLIRDPKYSVSAAFRDSVEVIDFQHSMLQTTRRVTDLVRQTLQREYVVSEGLRPALIELRDAVNELLAR